MYPQEALHTAVRRYCKERHKYWAEKYNELQGTGGDKSSEELDWHFTDDAYDLFPRYLVLEAILNEVERLNDLHVYQFEHLKKELVGAGWRAQSQFTTNLPPRGQAAIAEERKAFAQYVASISERKLEMVDPLPFHRVLASDELLELWKLLDDRWKVEVGYWWPLKEGAMPSDARAFHVDWFDEEKRSVLREFLIGKNVDRMFELREFRQWGCELSAKDFDPYYNGEEGYWFSSDCDWLVYASHESSITIAGDSLVNDFRKRFVGCDDFQYEGPYATSDLRGSWQY